MAVNKVAIAMLPNVIAAKNLTIQSRSRHHITNRLKTLIPLRSIRSESRTSRRLTQPLSTQCASATPLERYGSIIEIPRIRLPQALNSRNNHIHHAGIILRRK